MRSFALFCGLLAACGPSPQQIVVHLRELEQLAVQGSLAYQSACKPAPAAGAPICTPLKSCLKHVQESAHACKSAIDVGATESTAIYSAAAEKCVDDRTQALLLCRPAGITLMGVPRGH
jgi:hypothetical protein